MEAPQFSNLVFLSLLVPLDSPRNEDGNLLNDLVEVHGGAPLSLLVWKQVPQQVTPIGQRRITKSCLRHYKRRLERKFIAQQYVEVKRLNTILLDSQRSLGDLKLWNKRKSEMVRSLTTT